MCDIFILLHHELVIISSIPINQIPYFEFLITSEFNLGFNVPRLPLWTTYVINSYIALDSVHGSKGQFGRLAVSILHKLSLVFLLLLHCF